MDPRDFHTLARKIAVGPAAAERRTAIGRSYFAVFNVAAQHLRKLGFPISKGAAAHGEIQKCLLNSGDADMAEVASDLTDLHSNRNRADYQLDKLDVEKPVTSQAIVKLAGDLIDVLDATFSGTQRPLLQAAIQKWRRDNGYP